MEARSRGETAWSPPALSSPATSSSVCPATPASPQRWPGVGGHSPAPVPPTAVLIRWRSLPGSLTPRCWCQGRLSPPPQPRWVWSNPHPIPLISWCPTVAAALGSPVGAAIRAHVRVVPTAEEAEEGRPDAPRCTHSPLRDRCASQWSQTSSTHSLPCDTMLDLHRIVRRHPRPSRLETGYF